MATAELATPTACTNAADSAVAACARLLRAHLGPRAATRATLERVAVLVAQAQGLAADVAAALCAQLAPARLGAPVHTVLSPEVRAAADAALEPVRSLLTAPGALGDAYEALQHAGVRKRRGSYYTPAPVAARVVARALAPRADALRARGSACVVLDPAMGAGRFLLAALEYVPPAALHGIDCDPFAVWLARVAVALAAGGRGDDLAGVKARLRLGDALAPGVLEGVRADVVVGNPPWVAHAGRQSVALAADVRADYRARFRAFAGFPTTHGMFVELAARVLAPGATLALLVPTQVADLGGYGPMRAALTAHARVATPLEELGFGQFADVTEPTLVLVATHDATAVASDAPWAVTERAGRATGPVVTRYGRDVLARLAELPRFPPETFGEAGFQSAGTLAKTHLRPYPAADARFTVPLREGRDVEPFRAGTPSRALHPDPVVLARFRARLRPQEAFARVSVVIRQTARYPIAAVHDPPHGFRNSLLAGYTDDPHALAALLNSALLRALHLGAQRDGRQAVFPQLKVAHLRALPAPPPGTDLGPLGVLARAAQAAQAARSDAEAGFAAAVGAERLPRGLFAPDGEDIPARSDGLARAFVRAASGAEAYERALADARAAWRAYRAATRAIDAAVYAMYGVREDERLA